MLTVKKRDNEYVIVIDETDVLTNSDGVDYIFLTRSGAQDRIDEIERTALRIMSEKRQMTN